MKCLKDFSWFDRKTDVVILFKKGSRFDSSEEPLAFQLGLIGGEVEAKEVPAKDTEKAKSKE